MDLADYEWSQIKSYLEAVRPRLTGPESEETLVDIESHIHMAIKARLEAGEQGNLVAAVLAELDRPEQYGPTEASPSLGAFALRLNRSLPPTFRHTSDRSRGRADTARRRITDARVL